MGALGSSPRGREAGVITVDAEEALGLLVAEYDRMAATYDAHAAPYYRSAAKELLAHAGVDDREVILDVGCGTGNLAFEAAEHVGPAGQAVGIDLAEGMVRLARQKAQGQAIPHLQFLRMDGRTLAFRDGVFDAVVSYLGIASLRHVRAFQETHRVLREAGRLVFGEFTGRGTVVPFRELLEKYRPEEPPREVRCLLEARRTIAETGEPAAFRDPEKVQETLRSCGFRQVAAAAKVLRRIYPTPEAYVAYVAAWGDNERELAAMSSAKREAFLREFKEVVAPMLTDEGLVVQVEHNFYLAQK